MSNSSQLYLLADHIKLSLLERQRAISLNLEPSSQDGHISRSLDQMRDGIEALESEQRDTQEAADSTRASTLSETSQQLRTQYDDLTSQFRGFPTTSQSSINKPNDPSLSSSFAHAKDTRPRIPSASSFRRSPNTSSPTPSKSVRFRDNPTPEDEANRAALFPYRDNPTDLPPDQSDLDNQQIHSYHKDVLQQQDDQLDRLGESIGRQRDLSIQIGDELDGQIEMLDDVDGHMDRHQGRLDGARRQLEGVYKKGKENWGLTIILVLVVILILLVIIFKS